MALDRAGAAKNGLRRGRTCRPTQLRLVRTLELDGSYVAARLVGSVVRIVAGSQIPAALPFVQPTDGSAEAIAAAERKNEAVVARSKVGNWLPSYGSSAPARRPAWHGRSSGAATCAARRRSPGSGC